MKGFMTFVLVIVLMVLAFFGGMQYFEQNHSYVSDRGINIGNIVDDSKEGVETLFEDVSSYFWWYYNTAQGGAFTAPLPFRKSYRDYNDTINYILRRC